VSLAQWDLVAQFVQAFAIGFVGWAAWEQRQARIVAERKLEMREEQSKKEATDGP